MIYEDEGACMETRACLYCGDTFIPKRNKDQRICSKPKCQRRRRTEWQRQKVAGDPDYRLNARESRRQWQERNPTYYREYRLKHPKSVERNRRFQAVRNARRRLGDEAKAVLLIANVDAFKPNCAKGVGRIFRIPLIAKKDAFLVDILDISVGYNQSRLIAKKDAIAVAEP